MTLRAATIVLGLAFTAQVAAVEVKATASVVPGSGYLRSILPGYTTAPTVTVLSDAPQILGEHQLDLTAGTAEWRDHAGVPLQAFPITSDLRAFADSFTSSRSVSTVSDTGLASATAFKGILTGNVITQEVTATAQLGGFAKSSFSLVRVVSIAPRTRLTAKAGLDVSITGVGCELSVLCEANAFASLAAGWNWVSDGGAGPAYVESPNFGLFPFTAKSSSVTAQAYFDNNTDEWVTVEFGYGLSVVASARELAAPIPEPSTYALMMLGVAALAFRRVRLGSRQ